MPATLYFHGLPGSAAELAAFGPEIAARAHLERIDGLVAQALDEAGLGLADLDAIAANWRALDAHSGSAEAGAAVKADAYGLGAATCVPVLRDAGCDMGQGFLFARPMPLLQLKNSLMSAAFQYSDGG